MKDNVYLKCPEDIVRDLKTIQRFQVTQVKSGIKVKGAEVWTSPMWTQALADIIEAIEYIQDENNYE